MKSISKFWRQISDPTFETLPVQFGQSYLPSLDGWRAFAILVVIVAHFFFETRFFEVINGQFGVDIFFVISGFLITSLLLKEKVQAKTISLKNFYTRRALRILPVAYLYLAVLVAVNLVFSLGIPRTDFFSCAFFIRNLEALHNKHWQTAHFWSLAVEEQFYLFFPFLLKFNYKLFIRTLFGLLLFVPVLNIINYHSSHSALMQTLVDLSGRGTTSILYGALGAVLLFKGMISANWLDRHKKWALVLFLFILLDAARADLAFPGKETIFLLAFGPATCLLLLLSMQKGTFFYTVLNAGFIRRIGILSYSLYIWQMLFTAYQPWSHAFPYGSSFLLNIPALFIVACLSYYGYEKRFLRLRDKFKPKPSLHGPVDRLHDIGPDVQFGEHQVLSTVRANPVG